MTLVLTSTAITATLRSLLQNGLVTHGITDAVGDVAITALPPDRIVVGSEERNQLNLFLYRIAPHLQLTESARASLDRAPALASPPSAAPGQTKAAGTRPPALELYYLVTAYAGQSPHAEVLLDYAIQMLADHRALTAGEARALLAAGLNDGRDLWVHARPPWPPAGEAGSVEEIRITPQYLSTEELSKLWAAFQARFRPSVAYRVLTVPPAGRASTSQS